MKVFSMRSKISKNLISNLQKGVLLSERVWFESLEQKLRFMNREDLIQQIQYIKKSTSMIDDQKEELPTSLAEHKMDHITKYFLSKLSDEDRELVENNELWLDKNITLLLSRSQVLFILYLHFCNVDSNGIIKGFSIKHAATKIGVSERTIYNNIKILRRTGLVSFTEIDRGVYSAFIKGYSLMTKSTDSLKEPYLQMSTSLFERICSIKNVNLLRFEMKRLLSSDNAYKTDNQTHFAYQTIKRSVPKHLRIPSKINKLINYDTGIFNSWVTEDSGITFSLHESLDFKKSKDNLILDLMTDIHIRETDIEYPLKDHQEDIIQMCIQYGKAIVFDAITNITIEYIDEGEQINNIGGLIRTLIERDLYFDKHIV